MKRDILIAGSAVAALLVTGPVLGAETAYDVMNVSDG
jgi:hypothetical protein